MSSSDARQLAGPFATKVSCSASHLVVTLSDGRILSVPLEWYPRLAHASATERDRWELIGDGDGIHWPDLDEDLSVEGLLAGNRSGESQSSLDRWLKARR